jgi:hypothetical protein
MSRSEDVTLAFGLRTIPDNVGNILLDSATWRNAKKAIRTFLIKENYRFLRRGTAVALFSITGDEMRCWSCKADWARRIGKYARGKAIRHDLGRAYTCSYRRSCATQGGSKDHQRSGLLYSTRFVLERVRAIEKEVPSTRDSRDECCGLSTKLWPF